ncbi:MAG: SPOR domain-containing protein [Gammaproteobacteria bacterium]
MDQQLKERLVGATVLVVVGILFIPLLLDGPDEQTPVRVGLELPVPDSGRRTHTIRLDVPAERPATQASGAPMVPMPVSKAESSDALAAAGGANKPDAPVRAASKPEPEPESKPKPATTATQDPPATRPVAANNPGRTSSSAEKPREGESPTTAAAGDWAVQIGSFSSEENAMRLQSQLKAAGFSTFRTRLVADGRTMHRVRVGPVADRSAADALASRLGKAGYPGRVVATDD